MQMSFVMASTRTRFTSTSSKEPGVTEEDAPGELDGEVGERPAEAKILMYDEAC